MSSPKEKENLKERENLKTVIERYEKVIEKLEIQRINKMKKINTFFSSFSATVV